GPDGPGGKHREGAGGAPGDEADRAGRARRSEQPDAGGDRGAGRLRRRSEGGTRREHEAGCEDADEEQEADDAQVGERLDEGVLDAVLALRGREGKRRDLGKLPARGREIAAVYARLLAGGLPARTEGGVVEEDPQADVGEERVLGVRLDLLTAGGHLPAHLAEPADRVE